MYHDNGAVGSPEKAVNLCQAKWCQIQDVSTIVVNAAITLDGIQFYSAYEGIVSEQAALRLHCTIISSYSGIHWVPIFGRQPVKTVVCRDSS
jgi:hypothetical protein